MQKYVCDVCGYVYDPEVGDPDSGVSPGTAFEDIPDDWVCPLCGVGKEDFSPEDQKITIKKELKLFFLWDQWVIMTMTLEIWRTYGS